jgi:two-component system, chemotaxis family, response regulator Rcp1
MPEIEVLLVEDNRSDVVLLMEALEQAGIRYELNVAKDGAVAMEFLLRQGAFALAPRPGLIILDLNLPRKGGQEVLCEITSVPDLRRIPLVVLTSSTCDQGIIETYGLRYDSYMVKPSTFHEYVEIAKGIEAFRRRTDDLARHEAGGGR